MGTTFVRLHNFSYKSNIFSPPKGGGYHLPQKLELNISEIYLSFEGLTRIKLNTKNKMSCNE